MSDLTKETRRIVVDVGASELLEVEYRVHALTPEVETELAEAERRPAITLAKLLCRIIATWTLEDDSGQMYPIREEHVARLPLAFIMSVFKAVVEDMRPNLSSAGT